MPKQSSKPDVFTVSQAELARIFGVSARAVREWACPRRPDGRYSPAEVISWYTTREIDRALIDAPAGNSDSLERWRRVRADLSEIELARICGTLIDVEAVKTAWTQTLTGLRNVLLALPAKLAPACEGHPAREIFSTINDEIRNAIEEFAACPSGQKENIE